MDTWDVLGIVAIILLIIFFSKGKNAIWGALTFGVVMGLIMCFIRGFEWNNFKKWPIGLTLSGALIELLYLLIKHNSQEAEIERRIRKDLNEKHGIK